MRVTKMFAYKVQVTVEAILTFEEEPDEKELVGEALLQGTVVDHEIDKL
jgi:hypothetical protein